MEIYGECSVPEPRRTRNERVGEYQVTLKHMKATAAIMLLLTCGIVQPVLGQQKARPCPLSLQHRALRLRLLRYRRVRTRTLCPPLRSPS